MAIQKIYFANAGVPETGLTLTWESLVLVSDGSDVTPKPSFVEIGGGWYKFIQPTITEDLVGVIDGGVALDDIDRYVPADITPDDFGMTDLLDAETKGSQVLDPGADTLTLMRRDGITPLVVFDLTKTATLVGAYKARTPQ